MQPMYYIGLDVHKQKISYCVKDAAASFTPKDWGYRRRSVRTRTVRPVGA